MRITRKKRFASWQLWALIMPSIAYLLIFCYVPMVGIIMGFQDYNVSFGTSAIFRSEWVGFDKFKMFFSSYYFWPTLKNTLTLSLYALAVNTFIPIIFALMINEVRIKWFKNSVQTIMYAPFFVSLVVLVGLCFSLLREDTGIISRSLQSLGFASSDYIRDPKLFSTIYTMSGLWQGLGWWSIIYVGALSSVDRSLHEAAAIDGANRFKRLWHINIPAIFPMATIQFILAMGSLMSVGFEKAFMFQQYASLSVSEIIATYTYKIAFVNQVRDYSFATAVGLFNSVINLILLFSANFLARFLGKESLW